MDLPKRKQIRLRAYDYSAPGAYFVTICTHDRRCILSSIAVGEGLAPPAVALTPIGQIVEEQIQAIPARYPAIDRKIRDHAESRPFTRFDSRPLGRGKPLPYGGNGGVFVGGRHVALAL